MDTLVGVAATVRRSAALGRLGVDVARARHAAPGPARDAARALVAGRMGRLRGLPQKIGQMLSLADLEAAGPFDALTDGAPPAPASDSFTWIAGALGRPVAQAFATIDPHAFAASLGQVHRAVLPDGRAVAVKIQYPEVGDALEADLGALGLLAAPLSNRASGFDVAGYRRELRRSLTGELDYRGEAEALRRFARRRYEIDGLVTPDPIDGYCTDRLLTMTWVDGGPVRDAATWPRAVREQAMRVLLQTFLRGCFVWREIHADPHAGNVRFAVEDGQVRVGLIDFGCTRTLTDDECRGLWTLAAQGASADVGTLAAAWAALGFPDAVTAGLRHRLRDVAAVLFEPFASEGPFDARRWQVADRLAAALGDDRWTFRFAGPPALLFLIRAFQGLVAYARALDAPIAWRGELLSLTPPVAAMPAPSCGVEEPRAMSDHMKVEVVRDGARVAFLTFPAAAVAHLPDLVPDDLAARVAARGISLDALASAAVAQGCAPGEVFALDDGGTRVRVWIE